MASTPAKVPPLPLLRALGWFRDGLAAVHRRLVPGHIALLELNMTGFLTQAINAAAELGIADALRDGPRKPEELARTLGVDEDALRRLMRLLISFDVFTQRRNGAYTLTGISQALRSDAEVTLRDIFLFFGSGFHRKHWTHLADAVRTGHSVGPALDGMPFFEYAAAHRDIGDMFDRAMTSVSTLSTEPLFAAYDFGRFDTLVDVGGGHGSLLTEILERTAAGRGIIFDLPEVVTELPAQITKLGLAERLSVQTGSFFEAVPKGGDAYILKHIIHDWSDAEAERILRTMRTAMEPDACVLIIDIVLPGHQRPHAGKFIDLEMLVNATGRERTEQEFRNLLARSGFTLTRIVPTAAPESVLEARPAR
ncbi:hydroxyneurosporene methyltransferase [Nocardia sp. SYP-A9097]|uniref:methyltransferase n=1 Tax=Nocardia sp. SYP-A9097 TaxID=2663237 RepID=UPI00129AE3F5|nr:methyltransferase [Nocardia sp. SYP-A9097]MRH89151.1 hydroxyneurosporene methyltransferase [Nocardia sp. SYP-A9097]